MSETANNLVTRRIESLLDDNSFVELYASVTSRSTDFNLDEFLFEQGIPKRPNGINNGIIKASCVSDNGVVYAVISETNKLLSYDIRSKQCDVISIGDDNCRLRNVAIDGDILYLCTASQSIVYMYDISSGKTMNTLDITINDARIEKTLKGKILIDSIRDGKCLLYDGENLKKYESKNGSKLPGIKSKYTYGIVFTDVHGQNYYYDRFSYEIKTICDDGLPSDKGIALDSEVDLKKIAFPRNELMIENNEINLRWMLKTI